MLTNSQYDAVKRIYDQRQYRANALRDERTEEVIKAQPAIAELNQKIIDNSIRAARLSLTSNDESAINDLRAGNNSLIRTKRELIRKAGYPVDYLENVYECPECNDTGFIRDGDGAIISHCKCFTKTVIDTLYMNDTRRELLSKETFEKFNYDLYSPDIIDKKSNESHFDIMMDSVNVALDFTDSFDDIYSNLFISGETGTGKTYLANCIAGKLISSGHSVLYLSAYDFFDHCRKYLFSNGTDAKVADEELDFIYNAECLIIDDLGSEQSTSFTNSQLFVLLEKRHLAKKATVITSNLSHERLKERYSERICSRLLAHYDFLTMPGKDNRRTTGNP